MRRRVASEVEPFVWSEDGTHCKWGRYDLCIDAGGTWVVLLGHHRMLTSKDQTPGTDLMDAQRRAQAAAMVLNSLRIQSQS